LWGTVSRGNNDIGFKVDHFLEDIIKSFELSFSGTRYINEVPTVDITKIA
jgi:hypothetical protein